MVIIGVNPQATQAETEALPADRVCNVTQPSFNYASVIGVLQYKCSGYIHSHTSIHIESLLKISEKASF